MTRAAALMLAFALAGCGFHPLYGGMNAGMQKTLSTIYVEPMPDKIGFELRNTMIDLLDGPGTTAGAAYRLKMTLNTTSQSIALQNATAPGESTVITRYNDRLSIAYELTDMTGKVVTKGVETGFASYNVLPSLTPTQAAVANYGTFAAQQDADRRAAQDIAERIRLDLNVYFAKR